MTTVPLTAARSQAQAPPLATVASDRVGAINGLRALAMFWVFSRHAWETAGSPALHVHLFNWSVNLFAGFGHSAGVELYTVICGFCVFYPMARRPELMDHFEPKRFYIRRFWRLTPAYYAAIAFAVFFPIVIYSLLKVTGHDATWKVLPNARQVLTHVFYVHTFWKHCFHGINASFWAMGLFVQLYLVFPLVIWAFRRWGRTTWLLMAIIAIAYEIIIHYTVVAQHAADADPDFHIRPYTTFFLGRWTQFAAGMMTAWILCRSGGQRVIGSLTGTMMVALAIATYIMAEGGMTFIGSFFPERETLMAISYALLGIAVMSSRTFVHAIFDNRLVARAATISFSFYLLHQSMLTAFEDLFDRAFGFSGNGMLMALWLVGLPLVLLMSAGFYRLFEYPFYKSSKSPAAKVNCGG